MPHRSMHYVTHGRVALWGPAQRITGPTRHLKNWMCFNGGVTWEHTPDLLRQHIALGSRYRFFARVRVHRATLAGEPCLRRHCEMLSWRILEFSWAWQLWKEYGAKLLAVMCQRYGPKPQTNTLSFKSWSLAGKPAADTNDGSKAMRKLTIQAIKSMGCK